MDELDLMGAQWSKGNANDAYVEVAQNLPGRGRTRPQGSPRPEVADLTRRLADLPGQTEGETL